MTTISETTAAEVIAELQALVGSPTRITLSDPRSPDGTLKIPGTIRQVSEAGIAMELFIPLLRPMIAVPAILEVVAKHALLQGFTSILSTSGPQSVVVHLPEELHRIERRRFPRVPVSVPVTVVANHRPDTIVGTVANISEGGCAVVLSEPVTVGAQVQINLQATNLAPATASAHVVRCSLVPSVEGRWEAGLAFHNLTAEQKQHLHQYVNLWKQ